MTELHATSLANPTAISARECMLGKPHITALEAWRAAVSTTDRPLPHFDPLEGGSTARLLILLETPGPGASPLRFVSCDNPTGTTRNLRRFVAAAGIARREIVLWNAVPWVIHAPGARNRSPNRREITAGVAMLPAVIERLPQLGAIVLAGRVAALARPMLEQCAPEIPIVSKPHPSPTYVCTSPEVSQSINAVLLDAAKSLHRSDGQANRGSTPRPTPA